MESSDATIAGDINRLPEECLSHVISLTRPRDAHASSHVSRAFRSAANSDATWQRFLPSDHDSLLSQAVDPVEYASKKELYFRLCDHHVLIDGGKMSFGLEKSRGAKCFMISARALSISKINDLGGHWDWIDLPDSRFRKCARLKYVYWLEIHGNLDSKILTPHTTYAAYLTFKVAGSRKYLGNPLQETKITMDGDTVSQHSVCLDPEGRQRAPDCWALEARQELGEDVKVPHERVDGWMEIEIGEFCSGDGDNGEVDMALMEVTVAPKGGLIVQGIEVRPKQ